MKTYNIPVKLDVLHTVPEGYAAAHMPELLRAVSRDNMAFFCFGLWPYSNPRSFLKYLRNVCEI